MSKILICVPCMDMVASGFAQSLAMLQKGGHEVAICFECGSLVYDARNKLAKRAVEMGAEYTMWFDSDMIFQPDTMIRLLEHKDEGGIISGVYFRRSPPYTPVVFAKCNIRERSWADLEEIPTELVEVEGVGFGCVLVSTDVLMSIAAKDWRWFEPLKGFGEDLSFCWRARECGYKIILDPSVKCGHVGNIVVTEQFFNAYGGAKNEGKS